MAIRAAALALGALVASACAGGARSLVTAGEPLSGIWWNDLGSQVEFDHGCPRERIRVIRAGAGGWDLDVCGAVRRYKPVGQGEGGTFYLDVTGAYPPSALPAPLPPAK